MGSRYIFAVPCHELIYGGFGHEPALQRLDLIWTSFCLFGFSLLDLIWTLSGYSLTTHLLVSNLSLLLISKTCSSCHIHKFLILVFLGVQARNSGGSYPGNSGGPENPVLTRPEILALRVSHTYGRGGRGTETVPLILPRYPHLSTPSWMYPSFSLSPSSPSRVCRLGVVYHFHRCIRVEYPTNILTLGT